MPEVALVRAGDERDGEDQYAAVTESPGQSVTIPCKLGASVRDEEMALLRAEIMRGSVERAALLEMVERNVDLEAA